MWVRPFVRRMQLAGTAVLILCIIAPVPGTSCCSRFSCSDWMNSLSFAKNRTDKKNPTRSLADAWRSRRASKQGIYITYYLLDMLCVVHWFPWVLLIVGKYSPGAIGLVGTFKDRDSLWLCQSRWLRYFAWFKGRVLIDFYVCFRRWIA